MCRTYHEIALDEVELVRKALTSGIALSTLDLVVVIVKTGDVGVGELGDLAGRATNTAADVQDLHASLDADLHGEVVLMAGNSLIEGLADRVAAEMEALAPAVLV